MNIYNNKEKIIPEKTIFFLYKNSFLSDGILKINEYEFIFHKSILASASDFIYQYLLEENNNLINNNNSNLINNNNNNKTIILIPEYLESKYFNKYIIPDCIDIIFKYIYSNQNFDSIIKNINKDNIFTILPFTHCLQIKSLLKNLEKYFCENILKDENVLILIKESILFELNDLHNLCLERLIQCYNKQRIKNVLFQKELMDLNYIDFKKFVSSDVIDMENEKQIYDTIKLYIESRRLIKNEFNQKELSKQNIQVVVGLDTNNVINNSDNNNINNEEKKEVEFQTFQTNTINSNYLTKWKNYLDKQKNLLIKFPLKKIEEKELILCIRFSLLSNQDLILISTDPFISDYNDFVLQGISLRLNEYEKIEENSILFNTKNRYYLSPKNIPPPNDYEMTNEFKPPLIYNKNYSINNNIINSQQFNPIQSDYFNNNSNRITYYNNENKLNQTQQINYNNNNNTLKNSQPNKYYFYNKNTLSNSNKIQNDSNNYTLDLYSRPSIICFKKTFYYQKDFDQNGIFYYLGTLGYTSVYCNPHIIGQVKVFCSSIESGNISELVGRNFKENIETKDIYKSYFGIDLGSDRLLNPLKYSIKNNNSNKNTMLSWTFEGSNDLSNFVILDQRNFINDKNLVKEKNLLINPGITATWGVNKELRKKYIYGFRYFILKQIDKNSSGNNILSISGIELYGEVFGKNWNFE